jgi:hypothetical protein
MGLLSKNKSVLYKYRDWNDKNHKKLLYENQLYLTPPNYFNDPFDCKIPLDFRALDNEEKIDLYINQFLNNPEYLRENKNNIKKDKLRLYSILKNDLETVQKKSNSHSMDNYIGVLSLSLCWDNILMWSHYSNFHKGFCVGFWEDKLKYSGKFGKGGLVNYCSNNDFPLISPLDEIMFQSFKLTHSKANDWKYEKEYRLTKLFDKDKFKESDRLINIPDDFFAEIIIGLNTPDIEIKEIKEIAIKKNVRIFKIEKVPYKFQLKRIELKY